MRKERFFPVLTALLALIALILYAYKVSLLGPSTDFSVYYRAAERLKGLRFDSIYTLLDGPCPFRYAPFFLPFFRPLAELSFERAQLAWFFIQFFCFLWGFVFLHRTLKLIAKAKQPYKTPLWITCASALFVLRFCLDCFTIGQVSSLMFFGLGVSLWAWTSERLILAGATLLIPSAFKIGPGISFLMFFGIPGSRKLRPFLGALGGVAFFLAIFGIMLVLLEAPAGTGTELWRGWINIVTQAPNYFDSAHYGSQSILSFLLRLSKQGALTQDLAFSLHHGAALFITGFLFWFWISRSPRNHLGRAFFFSLGMFPYNWLMPETFKNALTVMAFPVALLLTASTHHEYKHKRALRNWSYFALVFGTLSLSLAGKDIVGDTLFFGLQNRSVPLFATFFLGLANLGWAFFLSTPRSSNLSTLYITKHFSKYFSKNDAQPLKLTIIVLKPCFPNRVVSPFFLKSYLDLLQEKLIADLGADFELLLAPYGADATQDFREAMAENIFRAKGRHVALLRIEQPPEPEFFVRAYHALDLTKATAGEKLIRASRQAPETLVVVKVAELRRIYARFNRGLRWNRRLHRLFMTTAASKSDLLSGNLLTSAALLRAALLASRIPPQHDLLFELELALCAQARGIAQIDLPCKISVPREKTHAEMWGESGERLLSLPAIYWRNRQGVYGIFKKPQFVTCDDWGISKGVNEGILDLAQKGLIQRASALANGEHLVHKLPELLELSCIDVGLHLNLTYARALTTGVQNPTPFRLLLKWLNPFGEREKLKTALASEFEAQIAALSDAGIRPCYLDGHHHAHLVPGVLETLAPLLKKHGISKVRLPYDPKLWWSRKFSLNILARFAAGKFSRLGLSSQTCFYPQKSDFRDFATFGSKMGAHSADEIIVHPALRNDLGELEFPDSYREGRVREYEMLLGINEFRT